MYAGDGSGGIYKGWGSKKIGGVSGNWGDTA